MNTDTLTLLNEVKGFIRQPYAWPGGYPLALVMNDGECLCAKCAKKNFQLIVASTIYHTKDGWEARSVYVNFEDFNLYCCNCDAKIESAYCED